MVGDRSSGGGFRSTPASLVTAIHFIQVDSTVYLPRRILGALPRGFDVLERCVPKNNRSLVSRIESVAYD